MPICKNMDLEDDRCRFLIDGKEPLCKRKGEFLCTETLRNNIPNMSHSARELWVKCKRAYYYYKVRGIQAKRDKVLPALKMGSMWDKFQENVYGKSHDLTKLAIDLDLTELEVARFNAITSAFKKLKLDSVKDNNAELQKKILITGNIAYIVGYVDRSYEDHFIEIKMSGRPQYYQDTFNIAFQVGTYFIANPKWKYVILEVARTPSTAWKSEIETIQEYEDNLTKDIIKRAPMYFPGIKRKECTYGMKFFRSEFPLESIENTYERIIDEILEASKHNNEDYFYQSFNCSIPFPCQYLNICKSGVISELMYTFRNTDITLDNQEVII